MKSRAAALAVALVAAFGCTASAQRSEGATPGGLSEADEQIIREMLAVLDVAFSEEDLEAVVRHYSPDVVHLPPGEPPVVGLAAVRARDSAYVTDYDAQLSSIVEEIGGEGNHAFARYRYTESWTPKAGGETTTVNGKGIALLERAADGSWKLTHWVWNNNESN